MVDIIFESHSTTVDNEAHRSSGHFDVELSEAGIQQSKELGQRYAGDIFGVIFCSDLQRSYKTAEIAFGERVPIIRDPRLRECDYGDLTRHGSSEVEAEKPRRIGTPFPNGESYEDCARRMRSFLDDLAREYEGKRILIIGHRATQYGLEYWLKGIPLAEVVVAPWQWQPGWEYVMKT
jgi:broad specificity phosphatase PhoE